MKTKGLMLVAALCFAATLCAQEKKLHRVNQFADLAFTAGKSQATVAASYIHNWYLDRRKKLEAGLGLRWSSYFGTKKDFTTAPARLARTNTTPFLIVFAGQATENWDTLNVQRPLVHSLNLTFNAAYNLNSKWSAGFNIDLIGFSLGRKSSAILTSNGITKTEPAAKPYAFNLLLTGDLDYGNLNSEYFIKYRLNKKWGIKGVYQFYFAEYETNNISQTAPDGTVVTRFRNKVNALGLGASYHF